MIAVFNMAGIPLEPPDLDFTIPAPPPREITMQVGKALAEQKFSDWQIGAAGCEIVFVVDSDTTMDPFEYLASPPRPIDHSIACQGGECGLEAHGESTVFTTADGRRLCYPGYLVSIGARPRP